ncbi:MAG: phytoene desaturase family protein [Dehalococcoidia bacterium]
MRVVIIGGGIGGLATAVRLQASGHQTVLLEKNDSLGGRCNQLQVEGFSFDTGPTLLLMKDVVEELFRSAGRRASDYLQLQKMEPNYRITFADGSVLDATPDRAVMAEQLDRFEAGAGDRYASFLRSAGLNYRVARARFVERNFTNIFQFATPLNLYYLLRTGALRSLFGQTRRYFEDERLRLAFTFQTMYLGNSPLNAPAIYSLLPYTELEEGIWFPRGGMYELVRQIARLATELGADIRTGSEVRSLILSGGRAHGVRTSSGEEIEADVVVANADLPQAYRSLLPESLRPEMSNARLKRLKFTPSAYLMYLGVDRVYPQLLHHNVFLAGDFRRNFAEIFADRVLPKDPSLYIAAPTRSDPSLAPPGCDNIYVLVPVPYLSPAIDWRRDEPDFRERVYAKLEALGLDNLRQHVVVERTMTPADMATGYNLARGSAFGLSHDFHQVGYFRPANRAKKVPNLYFVGASTVPGTGIPMVILGSRMVWERIEREQKGATHALATSVS